MVKEKAIPASVPAENPTPDNKAAAPHAPAQSPQRTKKDAVRKYLEANPGTPDAEIAKALGSQGIVISDAYVTTIKTQLKKEKAEKRRGREGAGGEPSLSEIQAAVELLKIAGSVEAGYAALRAAQKLRETFGC